MFQKLQLGRLAEVVVLTEAIRRGYTASFPWGGNAHYDLVIERDGLFVRVQVKTIYWDNSKHRWLVDLTKSGSRRGYTSSEVDMIACYREQPQLLVMFPISEVENRRSITIHETTMSCEW